MNQLPTERAMPLGSFDPVHWVRGAFVVVLALFWAMAFFFIVRRFSGSLARPLSAASLTMVGAALGFAAGGLRVAMPRIGAVARPQVIAKLDCWMIMAPAVLVALAVSLRDSSVIGLAGLWTSLGVGMATSFLLGRSQSGLNKKRPAHAVDSAPSTLPKSAPSPVPFADNNSPDESLGEDVTQWFTRRRDVAGHDLLEGLMRAEFAPGQRQAALHIAFCPPFTSRPKLEVEQLDGPDARIAPEQAQTYGVRIDLRLARPAEAATNVVVQFVARGEAAEEDVRKTG